ncbi:MBL fold metallo-hydrolase [Pontitalea aquivivens]|uniref:MBL fold metallo-hydrolase n=1 Tax=Pontitalea aquivivens TaxID=3388663 RepID=UPI0039706325
MTEPTFTRRSALLGAAAVPLAAAMIARPRAALANAPMAGPAIAPFHRVKLGNYEVTTLLSGTRIVEKPQEIFGLNATPEDFAAVSAAAFIPVEAARFYFTPTLVNTGAELVLFDTGNDPAGITAALAAAGVTPDQVDVVVLTHMHGDHIGGLSDGTTATFANARYVTGAVEHNHWSAAGNEGFDTRVKPLNDKMTFVEKGGEAAPGISAIEAFGHTPGHMAWRIESEGQGLIVIADAANHYVWSLEQPDWEVRFDMDKAAAAATRKELLGMIAADRLPFTGYHMPFPAMGYLEPKGAGFRFVPASYQLSL